MNKYIILVVIIFISSVGFGQLVELNMTGWHGIENDCPEPTENLNLNKDTSGSGIIGTLNYKPEREVSREYKKYDYYISSSNGNDSWDGLTEQTAWASFSRAITDMTHGKVLGFKGGDTWKGTNTISGRIGSEGSPIIITSYGIGQAKFTGMEAITGWMDLGNNMWRSSTKGKIIYQVAVGDKLITNGRFPNVKSDFVGSDNYSTVTSVDSQTTFTVSALAGFEKNALVGASIHVLGHVWEMEKRIITSYNTTTGQISVDKAIKAPLDKGDLCFINNEKVLCDQQYEWYYDSEGHFLYMYSITKPNDINAVVENLRGIRTSDSAYITFDNIEVNGFQEAGFLINKSEGIRIENCTIKNTWRHAVVSYDSNVLVHKNTIDGCTSGAIYLQAGGTITNNKITNIGLLSNFTYWGQYSLNCPVIETYKNTVVTGNDIENAGYHGILLDGPTIVKNNFIKNTCLTMSDGAAIYAGGSSSAGSVIENNICLANPSATAGWKSQGIYMDEGSTQMTIRYNGISGFNYNIQIHCSHTNTYSYNELYKPKLFGIQSGDKSYASDVLNNKITYNSIYTEGVTVLPINIYNVDDNFDIGTMNNNAYFNSNKTNIIKVTTRSTNNTYSLSKWRTLSGEDLNSTDGTGLNITDSQFVYNETEIPKVIGLTGTWHDLSGAVYSGEIHLQPFRSKVLIKF